MTTKPSAMAAAGRRIPACISRRRSWANLSGVSCQFCSRSSVNTRKVTRPHWEYIGHDRNTMYTSSENNTSVRRVVHRSCTSDFSRICFEYCLFHTQPRSSQSEQYACIQVAYKGEATFVHGSGGCMAEVLCLDAVLRVPVTHGDVAAVCGHDNGNAVRVACAGPRVPVTMPNRLSMISDT